MITIDPAIRRWLYAIGVALVPVLVAFGWLSDEVAPAILGLVYAVFMGGLAAVNVPRPEAGAGLPPHGEDEPDA